VSEANIEIARRAYAAFSLSGIEGILPYLDPEIEWRMWERFSREPRIFRGHDGVRKAIGIFEENYDDFKAEPKEFIDAGDCVVVPVTLSGNVKGTGKPAEFDLVQVWTARGTRAARLDVYSSREEALAAVGMDSAESADE
jgi:ketosteroid isomerase-like protein